MIFQVCLCGAEPRYVHAVDCPRPLYRATDAQETTWLRERESMRYAQLPVAVRVIEWPQAGSARRYPHGGWWVVEERPGPVFFPLAGPFRREAEADAARAARQEEPTT